MKRIWVNGCPFVCDYKLNADADSGSLNLVLYDDPVFDRGFYPEGTQLPSYDPVFPRGEDGGPLVHVDLEYIFQDGDLFTASTSDLMDSISFRFNMKFDHRDDDMTIWGVSGLAFVCWVADTVPPDSIRVPKSRGTGVADILQAIYCWGEDGFCTAIQQSALALLANGHVALEGPHAV